MAPENNDVLVLEADAVMLPGGIVRGHAVAVQETAIAAVGPLALISEQFPDARRCYLSGHVLMPGFVNAHQHGSGLTSIQLGNPDDHLEPWLLRWRKRKALSPFATTAFSAMEMAANGVTAAIQANTPYATGDFEGEIRSFARAYRSVGLRAMIGIGARDRGEIVYPDAHQDGFLASLPDDLRRLIGNPKFSPYAGDAADTIAVMNLMQQEHRGEKLLAFAYAPAGPQWVSDEMWTELAVDAATRNVAIHTHAVESCAQAQAVAKLYPNGFLAHFEKLGILSNRLALAHAVWLTDDDVRIVAANGVALVRNAGSNLRLRCGAPPLARYLAAGANVALGSDSMTLNEDEDLFCELRLAANLARSPMWDGPDPLDARAMLRMSTEAGARAFLLGDMIGAIEAGRQADIIAVSLERICSPYLDPDSDFATAIYARAKGCDVRLTMVAGQVIYRDGRFPLLDRQAIVDALVDEAKAARIDSADTQRAVEQLVQGVTSFYKTRHARPAGGH